LPSRDSLMVLLYTLPIRSELTHTIRLLVLHIERILPVSMDNSPAKEKDKPARFRSVQHHGQRKTS